MSSKENLEIKVSNCSIRNEASVKLLGIHISNIFITVNYVRRQVRNSMLLLELLSKWTFISEECS